MSATISGNLSVPNDGSTGEKINALVEIVSEQQKLIEELQDENRDQQDRIDQLEDQVDDLQEEQSSNFEYHSKERADIHKRLSEVEESVSDDVTPTPEGEKTTLHNTIQEPQTAAEDLVGSIPSHAAEDHLKPTEQRCHFLLSDLVDYSTSVPAGRMMTSSDIKTILNAREENQIYSPQVSRVIEMLKTVGDGEIVVKDGRDDRGRRIVVKDDLAQRLEMIRRNTGVSPKRVTG